jgi:hypothetical protein
VQAAGPSTADQLTPYVDPNTAAGRYALSVQQQQAAIDPNVRRLAMALTGPTGPTPF